MQFEILPDIAIGFMLVFARVGTLVMLMPGIGERGFPVRVRLTAALLLTLVFYPVARGFYPADLSGADGLLLILAGEIATGLVLGITGRLVMAALQTAGTVIAQQLGLGFVTAIDPAQGQQGAILGSFLALVGTTLLFATDLHHLVILAVGDSYETFRPGLMPPTGDSARYVIGLVAGAFRVAVQISAPVLVFGLIFNLGLGLLARLMPQMQVFFIAVPASIFLGFAILALVLATIMGVFLNFFRDSYGALVTGG